MSLRARVFMVVGIVILVLNVLGLMWWQNASVKWTKDRKAFNQALVDAKRAGLPVTAKDLQVPLPPPGQNAAPLYDQMKRLVANPSKIMARMSAVPTAQQVPMMRRELRRLASLMALIHQATARPYFVFVRDWSDPTAIVFKEDEYMHMAMRLIAAESRVLERDGKPLEAVRNQALGFRIMRHAYYENMMDPYTAEQIGTITLSGLQKILYQDGSIPAVAEAVQVAVEKGYQPLSPIHALRTAFGADIITLGLVRSGGPRYLVTLSGQLAPKLSQSGSSRFWNDFVDVSGLKLMQRMRRLIDAVDLPFPHAYRVDVAVATEVEQDTDMTNWVSTILLPLSDDLSEGRADALARAEETRAAAAVLAWKARHGAFPETLNAAINPVPVDPFDLKPLRYRREGVGFVVFCVGNERPDKTHGSTDTSFHYPMPAYMKTK